MGQPVFFVVIATVGISGNATGFPTVHLACQVGRGKGLTYSPPKDFFSALGFWRLMTTTLETSGFAAPGAFVPAVKIPSDTASRSQAMAMELIKQNPIPQNVIEAFSNPATFRGECARLDGATNYLAEIMGSNAGHSHSSTPIQSERHQQTLRGVVIALEWLLRESQWDRRKCFEQLTLHALLPLYISPATEDWESSLKTTMYSLRRVACLSQLCKVLEREGMHEWLEHETRIQIAPQETVEKAFRICLTSLSESYWCSLHPAMDAGSPNTKQREDAGVEKGLWSSTDETHDQTHGSAQITNRCRFLGTCAPSLGIIFRTAKERDDTQDRICYQPCGISGTFHCRKQVIYQSICWDTCTNERENCACQNGTRSSTRRDPEFERSTIGKESRATVAAMQKESVHLLVGCC